MDKWSDEQLKKMELGGNSKALQFFQSQPDYREGMSIKEKYNSNFARLYREKLQAECEGRVWVAPPVSQLPNAQTNNSSFSNNSNNGFGSNNNGFGSNNNGFGNNNNGFGNNNNGFGNNNNGFGNNNKSSSWDNFGSNTNKSNSFGSNNGFGPTGGFGSNNFGSNNNRFNSNNNGFGSNNNSSSNVFTNNAQTMFIPDKAKNEEFFARKGRENENRRDDIPPSQGGKYTGFGSTSLRNDPQPQNENLAQIQKSLSNGWSFLAQKAMIGVKIAAAGASTLNENYIKPASNAVRDPNFTQNIGTYAESFKRTVSEKASQAAGQISQAYQNFQQGGNSNRRSMRSEPYVVKSNSNNGNSGNGSNDDFFNSFGINNNNNNKQNGFNRTDSGTSFSSFNSLNKNQNGSNSSFGSFNKNNSGFGSGNISSLNTQNQNTNKTSKWEDDWGDF